MPGKMRRIQIAGRTAEVPEENYEALVQQLEADGTPFGPPPEVAEQIPEGTGLPKGGPARGNTTPFVEPNPNMQGEYVPPKGVLEQLIEGGEDAISGLTHGVTLHNDANLLDLIGKGDQVRTRNAEAANRSPNVYGTAELIGGAIPNLVTGGAGMARQGLSALGRLATNVGTQGVQGMAQGYARGYGDSDPEASEQERTAAALENAGDEGILSALVAGGASALGGVADWGKDLMARAGDKARAAAVGFQGQDLKQLARSRGLDFVTDNVGRLPDELGVTNRFLPQSAEGYANRLASRATQADDQITLATRDAAAQGVQGPGFIDKPGMVGQVRQARNAAARGPLGDRVARANALEDVATGMEQQPLSTPEELRALKTAYDQVAYPNALQGSSESLMGQAHKTGGDVARGELRNAMSFALPETEQAFTQGNIDYGNAATLSGVARDAAAQRFSGGGIMGNMGAAAVGAAAGMPFGQGMAGAALGLARPAYAAAQNYGADFGANIARGMEGASAATSRLGNAAGGSTLGSTIAGTTQSEQQRQRAGEARGYLGAQAVEMVLERNPDALGQYATELAQAQEEGNLSGVLFKLYQRDPEFRTRVYPQIQQLTRE